MTKWNRNHFLKVIGDSFLIKIDNDRKFLADAISVNCVKYINLVSKSSIENPCWKLQLKGGD